MNKLLSSMAPELSADEYVFCCVLDPADTLTSSAWAVIREREGCTLILERTAADRLGLAYESVFRRITLNIYSSLNAVGLTAAISAALTDAGISANVVAGYYHDHVFVPVRDSKRAVSELEKLTRANLY